MAVLVAPASSTCRPISPIIRCWFWATAAGRLEYSSPSILSRRDWASSWSWCISESISSILLGVVMALVLPVPGPFRFLAGSSLPRGGRIVRDGELRMVPLSLSGCLCRSVFGGRLRFRGM